MATTTRHEEISERFLDHAEAEFQGGDMLQASEQAWGAVAHYVKSVARTNNWPNTSHREISSSAGKLLDLTAAPKGNRRKFTVIDFLRVNYFDYELDPEDVALAIGDARTLVDAIREVELTRAHGEARVSTASTRASRDGAVR